MPMETTPSEIYEAFSGEIDLPSSRALAAKMVEHTYHGRERVVLHMSSPGGPVVPSLRLYHALRSTSFELVTCSTSEVESMAVVLFLAGDTRLASPEATFLVHRLTSRDTMVPMDVEAWRRACARYELHGDRAQIVEANARIRYLVKKESEIRQILEERTRLTRAEVERLVHQGKPISAIDALDMGIVHELIPARKA